MISAPGVDQLNSAIEAVTGSEDSACPLAREHLQAAHTYLLGGMPREYKLALGQAREAMALLKDSEGKDRVIRIIDDLPPFEP
jgi:hypothetical protein